MVAEKVPEKVAKVVVVGRAQDRGGDHHPAQP